MLLALARSHAGVDRILGCVPISPLLSFTACPSLPKAGTRVSLLQVGHQRLWERFFLPSVKHIVDDGKMFVKLSVLQLSLHDRWVVLV